jgi:hypothetical protein
MSYTDFQQRQFSGQNVHFVPASKQSQEFVIVKQERGHPKTMQFEAGRYRLP